MAVKKRKVGGAGNKAPIKKKRVGSARVQVELPTVKSEPCENLSDYSILLFGQEKIGKTSLASMFPGALFLFFEPGGKALSVYQKQINTWEEFKAYLPLLVAGGHDFTNIVIDTADIAYTLCSEYVCSNLGVSHPSEADYGKGWNAVRSEFLAVMLEYHRLQSGLLILSHDTEKEITRRNGETSHRIIPTMAKQARETLEGLVDIIAYYYFEGENRMLRVEGDDLVTAGSRLEHAFQKTTLIPMGVSSQESYNNFIAAYNNELVTSVTPEKKRVVRKKVVKKKK